MFVGVVAYADDLVLLAPNRSAAQNMLATCENFARLHNIKFSTDVNPAKSKSKALFIVGHNGKVQKPVPLILDEKELPYVEKCDHLGHILDVTGTMTQDCRAKRAEYVGQTVKLREQFQFAHPTEKIIAMEKHCTHFYGSNLWDLRSDTASMVYSSWRSSVKLAWGLPRNSKNFLIGSLLAPHISPPVVTLMHRQAKFFHTLLQSPSQEIQVLARLSARDVRTNIGSNLDQIRIESGLHPWTYGGLRLKEELSSFHHVMVPGADIWRIPYLERLLDERLTNYYNGNNADDDLEALIQSLSST